MSVWILSAQESENKCFKPFEIDSIYNKFVYFDYIGKENILLKDAIKELKQITKSKDTTIVILNSNVDKYKGIINNDKKVIDNLNRQLSNQKELTKIERKKKLPIFFKGVLFGGGIVAGLLIL